MSRTAWVWVAVIVVILLVAPHDAMSVVAQFFHSLGTIKSSLNLH